MFEKTKQYIRQLEARISKLEKQIENSEIYYTSRATTPRDHSYDLNNLQVDVRQLKNDVTIEYWVDVYNEQYNEYNRERVSYKVNDLVKLLLDYQDVLPKQIKEHIVLEEK